MTLPPHEKELDEAISGCLSETNSIIAVKFGFLTLGPLCNASESNAFTSASCHIENITNKQNKHYYLEFRKLFTQGISLLRKYKEKERLTETENEAMCTLNTFFAEKGRHQESLAAVFQKKGSILEATISVTLAEHLFKKLAPGKDYLLDYRIPNKEDVRCPCGKKCKSNLKFGNTEIGHEDGWHGSIDIVLSSCFVKKSDVGAKKTELWKRGDGESPKNRNIIEVKRSLLDKKYDTMNEAIAQTIVFSFLQRKSLRSVYFVPNILISKKEFRVIMYDSENDLLICSQPLCIFTEKDSQFKIPSIIILWMVLHYEMFPKNLRPIFDKNGINIDKFRSRFDERAKTNINLYKEQLKFLEGYLSGGKKEYFPSLENLEDALSEDVFKQT